MSKFYKALEQAEQERALRHKTRGPALVEGGGALQTETVEQHGAQPPREVSQETPDRVEEHLVSLLAPTSFEAEQYRALRHMIEQLHKSADLSVLAVSSPGGGDGKTTTAINLAGALAQAPEGRVLLVDADLRGSSLATRLGLDRQADRGLVEAILDPRLSLETVVQHCPPFNLSVVPSGHLPSAPYEVFKSPRVGELLQEARKSYDFVVLDTPPLVSMPDCRVIGKWVDGFLIVVGAHKTPRSLLEEALNVMDPGKIVGFIFNGDDHPISRYSYAYRGSSNGTGADRWGRAVTRAGSTLKRRFGRLRTRRTSAR